MTKKLWNMTKVVTIETEHYFETEEECLAFMESSNDAVDKLEGEAEVEYTWYETDEA